MSPSDEQREREVDAAYTQAMFRAVNEKMRELNESFGELTGTFTVACECADAGCVQMLELPVQAYERVRSSPRTFVVLRGHAYPEVEQVVAEDDDYLIVEMPGELAARIVDVTDPRARESRHG